jgi:hypothetical protein
MKMKRTQSTQPDARNRKRWIRPAIASGAGGTALVVWFEELLALAAEFLGVIVLPILAGIIYLFNHFVFKSAFPRRTNMQNTHHTSGAKNNGAK